MRSHEDAAGRRLHDASPGAPVVTATTARQLQAAIVSGAEHIEIRQHLDLTTLSILESDGESPINQDDAILGAVPSSVKSIRARCNTAPAADSFFLDDKVPLLPLLHNQCLLVTDGDVMQVTGDLWLDGLYLRMRSTVRFPRPQLLLVRGQENATADSTASGASDDRQGGVLWMSYCTVQGEQWNRFGGIMGLQAFGNVHAHGCTFANLGGELDAVEVRAPGAAAFCHSTFRDNPIVSERSAVIAARGADARLRDVTFSGNSGDGHLLLLGAVDPSATQHAAVYSDEPREVCLETALRSCERTAGAAGCERGVSSPVQSFPASQWPPADPLLASTDPWLQGTRKDLEPIYRQDSSSGQPRDNSMGDCTPEGPPKGSFALSSRTLVIVIACVATATLACAVAAAAFFFLRRRRRAPQRALHEQGKQSAKVSTVLHVHL